MGSAVFVKAAEEGWTPTEPGVRRRVLMHDDKMMTVEVAFEAGAVGSLHSHPHIQSTYIAAGRFEVTIAGETAILGPGVCFIVPSYAGLGCGALERGSLLDSFRPPRDEFLV